MEDAVYHCLDVFGRLGLTGSRTPHVVGLSIGGWMAAEIAWRYPEAVRSLTLVSAPGIDVPGHPMSELFGRRFDELAEETFADQSHPVAAMMHQMASLSLAGAATEIPFELIRPFFESMAAAAKLAWNPYFHNPKLPRRLGRVSCPTLVIAGRRDGLVPFQTSEAYARLIPGAELEILGRRQPHDPARAARATRGRRCGPRAGVARRYAMSREPAPVPLQVCRPVRGE